MGNISSWGGDQAGVQNDWGVLGGTLVSQGMGEGVGGGSDTWGGFRELRRTRDRGGGLSRFRKQRKSCQRTIVEGGGNSTTYDEWLGDPTSNVTF